MAMLAKHSAASTAAATARMMFNALLPIVALLFVFLLSAKLPLFLEKDKEQGEKSEESLAQSLARYLQNSG
jgi:Na+/phosphate symporter